MCLAQGPQCSDAGEAPVSSQLTLPLSHCAPLYAMKVKLRTKHHLEFLSFYKRLHRLVWVYTIKMPHCWKSHVTAYFIQWVPLWHGVARRWLILPLFAGLLEHEDGLILKALQKAPRGTRELHFYEKIFHKDCTDKHILELQQFLPQFFGAFHFEEYPEG